MFRWSLGLLLISVCCFGQLNPDLQELGMDFFRWRAITQPASGDDVPRVERPNGWRPEFSHVEIGAYREAYKRYRAKLEALPREGWSRADSVDYLILRAAMERVNWELNVLRLPHRNPDFYVHQTLGAVYELLLVHSPMTELRARNIIIRLQAFRKILGDARENLTEIVRPFADIALARLKGVDQRLLRMAEALKPLIRPALHGALDNAVAEAIEVLTQYAEWLEAQRPHMTEEFSIGREGYEYFLKNVALIPYSPETLLRMGRQEWERAVAFETYEALRNREEAPLRLFSSLDEQVAASRKAEESIRAFLEKNDIMTVPEGFPHYRMVPMPPHVAPLANMGVNDDLTSPTRLDEDAVRYLREPSPNLPYFALATAKDPRPLIVHEGIPGHYFQLARSWANPDPLRRYYIDSGANEGIAFYMEEMLLQFGLFNDSPHTREIIYNFMRLRALRVEVDIKLAIGEFTIEQAADYLAKTVPMDRETAIGEAGFFAYNPGQAISYQIGKLQILKFLADARVHLKDKFDLREFHDYLVENGNVPIALLRWEYLGLDDEVKQFFETTGEGTR